MAGMSEILAALAEALELEKELGTRTVDFDRALLRTAAPTPVPDVAISATPRSAPSHQSIPASAPEAVPVPVQRPAAPADSTPFKFLTFVVSDAAEWTGKSGELFDKMLAAIKLTRDAVSLEVASQELLDQFLSASSKPKAVVVFGSSAMRTMFGKGVRRGTWNQLSGIPAIVTVSPAYISRFASGSPDGLKAERTEVWHCLKSVVARIGIS